MMKLAVRDVVNLLPVYGVGKLFILRESLHIYLNRAPMFLSWISAIADLHMELTMLVLIDVKLDVTSCKMVSSDFR
jgi:hypothetical protein